MNKNDSIGWVSIMLVGLVIILAACNPEGGGISNQSSQQAVSSRPNVQRANQHVQQQQKDEMIRRVNSIIRNIGTAESHLIETEKTVQEEKKALNEIKENAQAAHLGGQMSDFRMWQRIGREKKSNIERSLQKAKNTILAARQGANSELQRVNWVSNREKQKHLKKVTLRLSRLGNRLEVFNKVSKDLARQDTWLNADE